MTRLATSITTAARFNSSSLRASPAASDMQIPLTHKDTFLRSRLSGPFQARDRRRRNTTISAISAARAASHSTALLRVKVSSVGMNRMLKAGLSSARSAMI